MKRITLAFLASTLVVSTGFADGGYSRGSGKPLKLGEFFCALVGGTAGGVITHAAGGSNPITFIGALIGGAIGVDACRWFGNEKNLGAQAAAFQAGLDDGSCGERSWRSGSYHGRLTVIAESYEVGGVNQEAGGDNTCKFFETTIHENGGKYIGRTSAWACKSSGQWIVTRKNWVSKSGYKTCNGQRLPENGEGSVTIGDGRVVSPTPIDICRIRGTWSLEKLRRKVNDYGVERSMMLAKRTEFAGYPELGDFKALSDDGRSVIFFSSPERQLVVPIEDVAIECRASGLCNDVEVTTRDGLRGDLQYIFQNGDVVIRDNNGRNAKGLQIRPANYIN